MHISQWVVQVSTALVALGVIASHVVDTVVRVVQVRRIVRDAVGQPKMPPVEPNPTPPMPNPGPGHSDRKEDQEDQGK